MSSLYNVVIHTDGSCLGNPGPGGIGYILSIPSEAYEKEFSLGYKHTTNNRMELTAALEALKTLNKSCNVTLHSDSKYLIEGMDKWVKGWVKNGWRSSAKKLVANREIWEQLVLVSEKHNITWVWVKAHAGDMMNEKVDALAYNAATVMKNSVAT